MKTNKKNLTQTERKLIAAWKIEGKSNSEIAKRLGRNKTTIGRELKRNGWKKGVYEPLHAQALAEKRKVKAWEAKHPLKNKQVFAHVMRKLRRGWSPEQIAGRLRKKHPKDSQWHISHEAIYQYIYHQENKDKKLWEYLRRGQKRRQNKKGRKALSSPEIRVPLATHF